MLEMTLFCVWLIPAQPYHDHLSHQIESLANAHQAPEFSPHVTLFCGKTENLDEVKQSLKDIISQHRPVQLKITSVDSSEAYYKTLYLQFEQDSSLTQFSEQLKSKLDPSSDYHFNPHMSLLYKNMPTAQKTQLAKQIWSEQDRSLFPNNTIQFDRIRLMSDSLVEGSAAVNSWKVLQHYWLGNYQ